MAEAAFATLHGSLLAALGPQGWWPAETAEEVVVGAVLTQAVAWINATRAIDGLRREGLLGLGALAAAASERVAPLIRPAGYFNVKARKLVALARFVTGAGGLARLAAEEPDAVRQRLLAVYGVGEETADAILCYALALPAMVCDAYARRVLCRIGLLPDDAAQTYGATRRYLAPRLPRDAAWLGEFHALLVAVGKDWCRPRAPRCGGCPAAALCAHARPHAAAPTRAT